MKQRRKPSPLDLLLIIVVVCIVVYVLMSDALGVPRSDLVRTLELVVPVFLAFWARTR